MFNSIIFSIIKYISVFIFSGYLIINGQDGNKINKIFSDALTTETCKENLTKELNLFGQFIGSWEFDWIGYNEDGTKQIVNGGEWIFSWVLEGRAIQDVWILPGRKDRGKPGLPDGEYGTTLRHYDPELKKWRVFWLGANGNRVKNFVAEKIGQEIILYETPTQNKLRKWIFSEITEKSFRWREETSINNGKNWRLTQEFHNKRTN